jgi:cell shape-determining protein MreC
MNTDAIDELIERLDKIREFTPINDSITALQKLQKDYDQLQQRIAELENDNQELANAIEETDRLNSER